MTLSYTQLGFGTSIQATCCNGHKFAIETPRNTSRTYNDPSTAYSRPNRSTFIHEDTNLLAIIACYLNGQGSIELKRIAASLNISKVGLTRKMFDKTSKSYLSDIIISEARAVTDEAMMEEINLSFHEKFPDQTEEEYQTYVSDLVNPTPASSITNTQHVDLTVSADMGWQKRSSGRKYDSPSGHMFFCGCHTNKIIDYEI